MSGRPWTRRGATPSEGADIGVSELCRQLESTRKRRVDAEKKTGEYRGQEAKCRTAAAKARSDAARATTQTGIKNKLRKAESEEAKAATAGGRANQWQAKASKLTKDEAALQGKLAKAERSESDAAERRRKREQHRAELRRAAELATLQHRMDETETIMHNTLRQLPAPKAEKLRILLLGSSSESGDGALRIGREQKRIRTAVESALHRDYVDLDARPAATTADLLDGIVKFRPHIVHFSGHSDKDLIVFEDEIDEHHDGVVVTATAFAAAVKATDEPPQLVLLNSCNSAAQIGHLVQSVAPFAIGMSDEIEDGDAITYAAQFYAALANGQSINSSHLSGQAALQLSGLSGADLPTLASADDVDPAQAILVKPPAAG